MTEYLQTCLLQAIKNNSSLEAQKIALLSKNRPRSAKLKKKNAKVADRSKKASANRHNNSMFTKSDFNSANIPEGALLFKDTSFDKDDKTYK